MYCFYCPFFVFNAKYLVHSIMQMIFDFWLYIIVMTPQRLLMQKLLSILKCKWLLIIDFLLLLLPLFIYNSKTLVHSEVQLFIDVWLFIVVLTPLSLQMQKYSTHSCPFWNANDCKWLLLLIYCCYSPFFTYSAKALVHSKMQMIINFIIMYCCYVLSF